MNKLIQLTLVLVMITSTFGCTEQTYFVEDSFGGQDGTDLAPSPDPLSDIIPEPTPELDTSDLNPEENHEKKEDKLFDLTELEGANEDEHDENEGQAESRDGVDTPTFKEVERICSQSKRLAIWLDPDNDGNVDPGYYLGTVNSYTGEKSAAQNYNYYSWSAHPIVGPIPAGFESHVFFYEGPEGLSLNFYFNVDLYKGQNYYGSKYNRVLWQITVSDNAGADKVLLSDERWELKEVRKKTRKGKKIKNPKSSKYIGEFRYWKNTDGGIIGPFVGENFKIHVKAIKNGDLIEAAFYSPDGTYYSLQEEDKISSFIITYETYETCIDSHLD